MTTSTGFLALDVGLAKCGWCFHNPSTGRWEAGLVATEKDAAKTGVNHSEDAIARCRLLHRELRGLVIEYAPRVLLVESLSFPRNAGATAKIGMAWGVVASLGLPTFHVPPMAVKLRVTGTKTASKLEVQAGVDKLTGGAIERACQARKIPQGKREHPYDAAAVVFAALELDSLRAAMAFAR